MFECILCVFSLVVVAVILGCIAIVKTTKSYPVIKRHKEEEYFTDSAVNKQYVFPSINEPSSVHLSVIIPAYNEEQRLPPMLDECLSVLSARNSQFKYELIIVSDGSKDDTVKLGQTYAKKYGSDAIRVLELIENRGKGGAVRLGMLSARGALLLLADADGATKFSDICKLEESINKALDLDYTSNPEAVASERFICIGSRAHLEDEAIAARSFFRNILMYGFHTLVWLFAVRGIRDTQCGFKLFTRQAARECFSNLHVERWAFDVELLYIAQQFKIPINEIAVNWTEIEGSKIVPVWSWLQMGVDLGLIWLRYKIGAWKLRKHKKE